MSGTSSENPCPICNEPMSCWSDWKPFETCGGECLNCGFCYYTINEQMKLKEINKLRKDYNTDNKTKLKPLTQKDLNKYKEEIKNI